MKKYRIVTNGKRFKVQRRFFRFFWIDLLNIYDFAPEYKTREDAQLALDRMLIIEKPWMEIL